MDRFVKMAVVSAACALGTTGAMAQAASQSTPPAATTPPAGAATTAYTDADIDSFATAAIAVQKIQQDATVPDAEKQTKMASAVTSSGLTAEKFNAIAQASQSDPALMKRIQTAATAKMQASPTAAPQAPAAGAPAAGAPTGGGAADSGASGSTGTMGSAGSAGQ